MIRFLLTHPRVLVFLPATQSLLRGKPMVPVTWNKNGPHSGAGRGFLRDTKFYLLLAPNLVMPLILTALFLYQIPLAEWRGWSAQTMASGFLGFAVARMLVSMAVGPLIDRWSALLLLPTLLVPALLGIGSLLVHDAPWIAWSYLILVGVSQGMAGPLMTAVWAEVYGVESLGTTKGVVATFGVMATALGPLLLGALLGAGIGFAPIIVACMSLIVASAVAGVRGRQLVLLHPGA